MTFTVEDFADLIRLLDARPDWQAQLRRLILSDELLQLPGLVRQLAESTAALTTQVSSLAGHVGHLRGWELEAHLQAHYAAYFGRLARRLRLVDPAQLADALDDAVDAGDLSQAERDDALRADLVLTGRLRPDGSDGCLVVEVSAGLGTDDVARAAELARVISRLGRPAIPVVAGEWINPAGAELADSSGVRTVLTPRTFSPLVA